MRRMVAPWLIATAIVVGLAAPAAAHTRIESTDPVDGALLDASPAQVVLRFTGSVEAAGGDVRAVDASGARVDAGTVIRPDDRTVVAPLGRIGPGGYAVVWRVVSDDGHPIGGSFTWRVASPSAGAPATVPPQVVDRLLDEQTPGRARGVVYGIGRFLAFAGLLVLVGAWLFLAAVWPDGAAARRAGRLLWLAWVAALAGTALSMASQWSQVNGADSATGQAWMARLVLLGPAALVNARRSVAAGWWRAGALAVGAGLLASVSRAGHATGGRWVAAAQVADVVHLLAAATWLGGVVVLVTLALRRGAAAGRAAADRFSAIAAPAIAVVVATGLFQSVRRVEDLDGLETVYGRLLSVKVVAVLAVIGVASLTRSVVRGRLPVEGDAIRAARRLVATEAALAVAVLGITALLVDADPTTATVAGSPFDETRVVGDVLVNVVVVPGTPGPTDIHLYVENPGGGLTPPLDAAGTLALGGESIALDLAGAAPGHWSAYDVAIEDPGDWLLTVDVRLTEFDTVSTTFTVPIGESS